MWGWRALSTENRNPLMKIEEMRRKTYGSGGSRLDFLGWPIHWLVEHKQSQGRKVQPNLGSGAQLGGRTERVDSQRIQKASLRAVGPRLSICQGQGRKPEGVS